MAGIERRVATGVVVRDDRVLLCCPALDPLSGVSAWDLPGTDVEPGEQPLDALVHELREELGLDVAESQTTRVRSNAGSLDLSIEAWIVRDPAGEVRRSGPGEHNRIRWFGLDELATAELAHPSVGELCALGLTSENRSFRFADPDDADSIAAYHHRCWVESFSDLLDPGVVAAMDPLGKLDRWRSWLAGGSEFTTIVADVDGSPVGHVTVSGHELVHLFIDPDHQGGRLGRSLLAVGEALIRVGAHRSAELQTIVGNQPAIDLYRSAGWDVTDVVVHNDHDGIVYDEHVLTKTFAQ